MRAKLRVARKPNEPLNRSETRLKYLVVHDCVHRSCGFLVSSCVGLLLGPLFLTLSGIACLIACSYCQILWQNIASQSSFLSNVALKRHSHANVAQHMSVDLLTYLLTYLLA